MAPASDWYAINDRILRDETHEEIQKRIERYRREPKDYGK